MDRWTYHGVTVTRHGPNSMGLRWLARIDGHPLRADTKEGLRELIRDHLNRLSHR